MDWRSSVWQGQHSIAVGRTGAATHQERLEGDVGLDAHRESCGTPRREVVPAEREARQRAGVEQHVLEVHPAPLREFAVVQLHHRQAIHAVSTRWQHNPRGGTSEIGLQQHVIKCSVRRGDA